MNAKTLNIIFFLMLIYSNTIYSQYIKNFQPQDFVYKNNDSIAVINIVAVGDLMCHSPQFEYSYVKDDSFNFKPVYSEVKKYLSQGDLTIGNLETVTAGKDKKYSGYPMFNTPDDFITALKFAGFNLLNTANNHALDRKYYGIKRTIEVLDKNKIDHFGTYSSLHERDSITIFDIDCIRIAVLAYTYGTNGNELPKKNDYAIKYIDFKQIKNDIDSVKIKNPDIILVHFHFGIENKRKPTDYQKNVVDSTISYGANIILADHPHVIEKGEFFKTASLKMDTGFVAYSLGNFFSNQRWRYSDAGIILKIEIQKNLITDSMKITKVNFIPTWVFKGTIDSVNQYKILPAEIAFSDSVNVYLTKDEIKKMKQAFEDTKYIFSSGDSRIKVYNLKIDKKKVN